MVKFFHHGDDRDFQAICDQELSNPDRSNGFAITHE